MIVSDGNISRQELVTMLTDHNEIRRTAPVPAYARTSVLDGGELPRPGVGTMSAALVRAAAEGGGGIRHLRTHGPDVEQSYASLEADAARVLTGMRQRGVQSQDKVLVHIDDEPHLLVAFWACILGGFVPVLITTALSGGSLEHLHGLWHPYDRVRVLTSRADDIASVSLPQYGWLGEIEDLARCEPAGSYHRPQWDDLALLLLTSGSTGAPKAVQLSHRNVLSRCVAAVTVNSLDSSDRSFNWLPFDHVGGLIMFHFRDVYLGCDQVHARMDWVIADPLRWLAAMSQHRTTITWAPNFAFRLITDNAARIAQQEWDLSPLRHIMNGGEPIYLGVLRRFVALLERFGLPPDAVHPGWGMSETSSGVVDHRFDARVRSTSIHPVLSVGRPHPGLRLRVVDEDDQVLPRGSTGLLQAAGEPITRGYYNAPRQNQETFTSDGWFRTGDLAVVEGDALTVRGRVADRIVVDGIECHAHEVEALVEDLEVAECSYVIATVVRDPENVPEQLAIFYNPRAGIGRGEGAARIRGAVVSRFGILPRYVLPVQRADIRKTEIGKLRRPELRRRFESGWDPATGQSDLRGEAVMAGAGS